MSHTWGLEKVAEEGMGSGHHAPLPPPPIPSGMRQEVSQGHSPSLPLSEEPPAIKGLTFAICPVLPLSPRAQGFRAGTL